MTGFTLIQQISPPPGQVPAFAEPGFFFNEPAHLCQQSSHAYTLLTAVNDATGRAEARCALFSEPETHTVLSPAAAPFGSVEFSQTLPDGVLDYFLQTLIDTAQQLNARQIRLINYPRCYAPVQADRLAHKLSALGFRVVESQLNQHVPVTNLPLEQRIAPSERRRLAKCQRAGFRFSEWQQPDPAEVAAFVQETRQLQTYALTLPSERLIHLLQTFPGQFSVFIVTDGSRIAALAVTVRVRADILYTFLPAFHPDYRSYSPMVLLMEGLYTHCQQERIRLLDLGVSLDSNRQPKPSLVRFKEKLGAQPSTRLLFGKALGG